MPIYMDRHDVSDTVTAEHVAKLHQEDLKIEHKFKCRGLTYWFDDQRKMAFCLIEAPNEEAIRKMHDNAHGELPHSIIEVDDSVVATFLGRIEDPQKAQNANINIIDDPAVRIIMVTGIERVSLNGAKSGQDSRPWMAFNKTLLQSLERFKGIVVKQRSDCFLVSFESVTKAVWCALELHTKFKKLNGSTEHARLKLGISAGVPVDGHDKIYGQSIKLAERMCDTVRGPITVSSEVKDMYESENLNVIIDRKVIKAMSPSEERFLSLLMDYTEKSWQDTELKVDDVSRHLGVSKSQLYRNMVSLTGKSPNNFIKDYRLIRALKLLGDQAGNIAEIAFETGYSSPSYFSKCFSEKYGVLPSVYAKQ